MSKFFSKVIPLALSVAGWAVVGSAAVTGTKSLHGHVPAAVSRLTPIGAVQSTNELCLAIGLPLRNTNELNMLLQQIYDPKSPNYHHFLTLDQFAEQFAPTPTDYQSVLSYVGTHGLTVTAQHPNRMVLEVKGKAVDVEKAFNVSLKKYHHPTENRDFFAPSQEPSVPANLAILDVSGLNNYARPHSKLHLPKSAATKAKTVKPEAGSGLLGSYMGGDFRAAYVPGTSLNGAGQKVALVQFDGYFASDISLYEQTAGLPSVSLTNILLNGFTGVPTGNGGEVEVSLDIEMVISMAPNINQVLVYEGSPTNFLPNVVLNQIAVDNAARQISSSWGWKGGPNATTEQIFLQMAVQGQSYYNASGDSDAFLPGQADNPGEFSFPSDSPNITQVGGTTLTTSGPGGSWVSEQVWNWGGGVGSSGGSSSFYAIPSWQQGIDMSTNHGSATGRNIPDVALTGDNVLVIADNGIFYPGVGGTSCAAPLWAGFTSLINQQGASNGLPSVGFINPALYALFKSANYSKDFYDITNGDNTWSLSPTNFFAVPGYDLCTGLGTPKGTNLIAALTTATNGVGIFTPIISAPVGPYGTNLAVLNGNNPNGDWFLFVQDDAPFDAGIISNGWSVTLITADPIGFASDNQMYASSLATNLHNGASYILTLSVTNYGPSVSSNVYVTDTLPTGGLTLTSTNVTAGSITPFGSTLIWNLGTLPIFTGASLTLALHGVASGVFTNTATVNSLTVDPNPDDDTVTTLITVASPPVPPVLSSGALGGGGFQLTVSGDSSYPAVVQASTNLLNWVNVYTSTPPFIFTNFGTTNYSMRFYRAVVGP